MSSKFVRTIRVDDKTWENAKRVATANGTTMSAMIAYYLKRLKETSQLDPGPPMAKGRHTPPRGKATSPRRAIWVPDNTWAKVHRIATFHETTVTAIIVRWLRGLTDQTTLKKPGDTPRRILPDGRRTNSILPEPKRRILDPADCPHPEGKEMLGRVFCRECGTLLTKMPAPRAPREPPTLRPGEPTEAQKIAYRKAKEKRDTARSGGS